MQFGRTQKIMSFTISDLDDAGKFTDYNYKVRLLRAMDKKAPHLVRHLTFEVRNARDEDYRIPAAIAQKCKVIDISISEKLCAKLSCNPAKEDRMCTVDDPASYYYVGDSAYDIQCQPSCFHTAPNSMYNESGATASTMNLLNYHNGKCVILPMATVTYLEKTRYRSDVLYEKRVNDMPTGFSRVKSNSPNGSGIRYTINEAYCKYYDLEFDSNGSCEMSHSDKILDTIIGMNLINTTKSAVRHIIQGEKPFPPPENLIALPRAIPHDLTVEGWREDFDKNFIFPSLITYDEYAPRISKKLRRRRNTETMSDKINEIVEKIDHGTKLILKEMFTSDRFWIDLGKDVALDGVLASTKDISKWLGEKISKTYAKLAMQKTTNGFGEHVINAGLRSSLRATIRDVSMRAALKIVMTSAKFVALSVSVFGIFLIISTALNLLFTFWDPFGYQNMLEPSIPQDMFVAGEKALLKAAKQKNVDFGFQNLVTILLSDDEVMSIRNETFFERMIYLNALEVNSEGTRIDKGEIVHVSGEYREVELNTAINKITAKQHNLDHIDLKLYNDRFILRVRLNKYLATMSMLTAIISVALVFAGFNFLGFLLLLFFIILLVIASLSILVDDQLIDALQEYRSMHKLNED